MNTVKTSLLVSIAIMAVSHAEPPKMRDAATGDDLALKFRKASLANPLQKMKPNPNKAEDPTKVNQPKDLIASSDFISFRGVTTLIPKRAILHVPKNYTDRIRYVPGTKIVIWPEFFVANRGWIKTVEVTRTQAEGVEPFDEKVAERIAKSSQLVVATYKGGPISVLPQKEPETVEEKP